MPYDTDGVAGPCDNHARTLPDTADRACTFQIGTLLATVRTARGTAAWRAGIWCTRMAACQAPTPLHCWGVLAAWQAVQLATLLNCGQTFARRQPGRPDIVVCPPLRHWSSLKIRKIHPGPHDGETQ